MDNQTIDRLSQTLNKNYLMLSPNHQTEYQSNQTESEVHQRECQKNQAESEINQTK
jgi:hypothetical protein